MVIKEKSCFFLHSNKTHSPSCFNMQMIILILEGSSYSSCMINVSLHSDIIFFFFFIARKRTNILFAVCSCPYLYYEPALSFVSAHSLAWHSSNTGNWE